MNSKVVLTFLLLVLAFVGLASIAASRTSAAPREQALPTCTCCPRVTLHVAPGCNCTLQIANEIRRIGLCKIGTCLTSPFPECGVKTRSCKLMGTATEVGAGCTGSLELLNVVANCGVQDTVQTFGCTNGSTNNHAIELDCDPCSCPMTPPGCL